jgi:hypothetical protein
VRSGPAVGSTRISRTGIACSPARFALCLWAGLAAARATGVAGPLIALRYAGSVALGETALRGAGRLIALRFAGSKALSDAMRLALGRASAGGTLRLGAGLTSCETGVARVTGTTVSFATHACDTKRYCTCFVGPTTSQSGHPPCFNRRGLPSSFRTGHGKPYIQIKLIHSCASSDLRRQALDDDVSPR